MTLADGSSIEADLLVVGIGVTPDTALADAAGLRTDNGVVVDEQLRTSAPDIFAAGDVANAYHPLLGRHLRVEHWDNAIGQGVVAAQNMLGKEVAYDRLPYFFSDQYDLGMEYLGNVGPDGYDQRGPPWHPRRGHLHRVLDARRSRPGRNARQRLGRDGPDPTDRRLPATGGRPATMSLPLAKIAANLH